MFGAIGVYAGDQIVMILRERDSYPKDNGVWLATIMENHESLQECFPNMRSLGLFGPGTTGWQILPVDAPDFEESVVLACELICQSDPRIGKVPKRRKVKRKQRSMSKTSTRK